MQEPIAPCSRMPCGQYSNCKELNGHAVCSCLPGMIGSPPSCRPECMANSQCSPDKSCINQKCQDPCVGKCGQDAECRVINSQAICSCPSGYTGDPFYGCRVEPSKSLSNILIVFVKVFKKL